MNKQTAVARFPIAIAVALGAILSLCACTVLADDVLATKIGENIKLTLSKMDSPQNAPREGPNWAYLSEPKTNLLVKVEVANEAGRMSMNGTVSGKIAFSYQMEVSKSILGKRIVIARHDLQGTGDATLNWSATIVEKESTEPHVVIKSIKLTNVSMKSDLGATFQRVIEESVNNQLQAMKGDLARSIKTAIAKR